MNEAKIENGSKKANCGSAPGEITINVNGGFCVYNCAGMESAYTQGFADGRRSTDLVAATCELIMADRDHWKHMAEARERAIKYTGSTCATCAKAGNIFSPCRECEGDEDETAYVFDESRFAGEGTE